MNAAAVEPGGHIHRAVGRRQRKVHDDIMGRKDFVDVVDRHTLGTVGGTRSVQPCGFIVNMRMEIDRRIFIRLPDHIITICNRAFRRRLLIFIIYEDDARRFVFGKLQSLVGQIAKIRIIDKGFGTAVIDDQSDFTSALTVIDRAGNRADFMGCQIEKYKFRRIEQGEHHDIIFADAVRPQRMRQMVGFGIQFPIGPAAARLRVVQGGRIAKAGYIA